MGADWPAEKGQAFLDWIAHIYNGADLAIALRGIATPGPLPMKAQHARRFRWGIAISKMLQSGRMSAEELEQIVCRFVDARRQRYAMEGIAAALCNRPAHVDEAPQSSSTVTSNAEPRSVPHAVVPYTSPTTRAPGPSPRESLYIVGKFVELTATHGADNRHPYLDRWRELTDNYYDDRGPAIGRMGFEWLAAGHALEASWRDAAHLAWGRAVLNHMRVQPQLTEALCQLAGQALVEPFRATAISAIQQVNQMATRTPTATSSRG